MDRVKIANRLKKLREKTHESQAEMAKIVGVTPSAYAMYESGERVPRDSIKIRIANHFGVTITSIFYD